MKKIGICPKCGSEEVYFDTRNFDNDGRASIFIAPRKVVGSYGVRVEIYACLDCGYFEEYFREDDLQNLKVKEKIKAKWQKVSK